MRNILAATAALAAAAVLVVLGVRPGSIPMADVPSANAMPSAAELAVVKEARQFGPGSGIVYVWGGESARGLDCSGYVTFVYKRVGIVLAHGTRLQYATGIPVPRSALRPGDVVFFVGSLSGANAGPPPGHVGIYVGSGMVIDYYSTGHPARIEPLSWHGDFYGARRYVKPVQVRRAILHRVVTFSNRFHVKVAATSTSDTVYFTPRRASVAKWAQAGHVCGYAKKSQGVSFACKGGTRALPVHGGYFYSSSPASMQRRARGYHPPTKAWRYIS